MWGHAMPATIRSIVLLLTIICSTQAYADEPNVKRNRRSDEALAELTPGKSYALTTVMVDGDEQITTHYWASVEGADERTVTLTNVFWSESVDSVERLTKKNAFVDRLIKAVNRLDRRKPLTAFGVPLKDKKLVLHRNQITTAQPLPEQQFEEMAEGSRSFHERRPRSLELTAKDQ
jgi:hypothetical protein